MPQRVQYTARFDHAELVQRGRTEVLVCRTYRDGDPAPPTQAGSTVTILDGDNDEVVSSAAVVVTDGVATYTLAGATTAALDYSGRWRVRWALVMPDGNTHTFENEASLCRVVPSPVITDASLFARAPLLNPEHAGHITKQVHYQEQIDEAWIEIVNRLVEAELHVEQILTPSRLRAVHLALTLAIIYETLGPDHSTTAATFRQQYDAAWGRLAPGVDDDQDGVVDQNKPARPPVWVG